MARRAPEQFLDRFGSLARAVRLAAAQAYSRFDVGSTQARFLRHLQQHPESSQAELARATATDPTLTGRVLQSLIERGWVRRERSASDRRQYVLELTAAGRRVCGRVDSARSELAERMVAALDERDLKDFDRVAGKLRKLLEGFDTPGP
jgi:DNA-binding MarR family transcriptional regulator